MSEQAINLDQLVNIGYDASQPKCGSFLVLDQDIISASRHIEGLEVMPLKQALDLYPHVRESRYFNLVDAEKNEHTRLAAQAEPTGYYIRVKKGTRVEEPLQAAFLMGCATSRQIIHNIIEIEEDAELHIVNGCTTHGHGGAGEHIGITETYIADGARLGYTMLHSWGEEVEVYPVGATSVGKNASYVSNYVGMTAVKKIVSSPVSYVAEGGSARFYSVVYARKNSYFDTGATVELAAGAGGEIISRVVSEGGTVISRQMLNGTGPDCVGHMECSGLMINEQGIIHSIPELRAADPTVNLSHEAAVGQISAEELSYLMTRGLTEEQARSLIIRGFLDINIEGMPPKVQQLIDETISQSVSGSI